MRLFYHSPEWSYAGVGVDREVEEEENVFMYGRRSRAAFENKALNRRLFAGVFLAIFLSVVTAAVVPGSAHAAECPSSFSAGGYFFQNYESVEYSPEGRPIQHLKVNYTDGRQFRLTWSYYDDECNSASVTGNQVTVSLPSGVSNWSVRLVSPTRIEVWNDHNNSVVTGFDIPLYPAYSSIAFGGTIDGGASTFSTRKLKMNQSGEPPVFAETLPKPEACASVAVGSVGGSNPYFFGSYEHAEYVDGLLRVHLRLKTPYNDGRPFRSGISVGDENCVITPGTLSPLGTTITQRVRYFSFRMISETDWQLWNDETNEALTCTTCSGTLPTGAKYVQWYGSIDAGASTISTTPFAPIEPVPEPEYAECCSSVVFLPGFEGSVLADGGNTLWPPTLFDVQSDLEELSFDITGLPINQNVTVQGIVDTFDVKAAIGPTLKSIPIYQGFSTFMDGLTQVDSSTGMSTIKEWLPLPYDWRYSPETILTDGIRTDNGVINPIQEVEDLAANSYTGKVTIVAHSYGGLVGKALIEKLVEEGKGELIDSFVMVGTPQLGTPQGMTALLHGDGAALSGSIFGITVNLVTRNQARDVAQNLPGAYQLAPSRQYFNRVSDPVLMFDPQAPFGAEWISVFGEQGIKIYEDMVSFMTAGIVPHPAPSSLFPHYPAIANQSRITEADTFHAKYDSFVFPDSVRVVQVAGWGLETIKGIKYVQRHGGLAYDLRMTIEGDGTVVYPSAVATDESGNYFFNLFDFNRDTSTNSVHKNLLSSLPVQNLVRDIIKELPTSNSYLSLTRPEVSSEEDRLIVSSHSPVTIGVTDSNGRYTGITPGQDSSADILLTINDIPGSYFFNQGDGSYISLPKNGQYSFAFAGTGNGTATVLVETLESDSQNIVAAYTDFPVTSSTQAVLSVANSVPSELSIDQNSDGQTDTYVPTDAGVLSLEKLLTNLNTIIASLEVSEKVRKQLQKKINSLENKITKKINKQSQVLAALQSQINKQSARGRINAETAEVLVGLLEELDANSATIPLDRGLLQEIKNQISVADISAKLKVSLMKKIQRLENKSALYTSLNNFTKTVIRKEGKGQISSVETQYVLNLLDQIQSAI